MTIDHPPHARERFGDYVVSGQFTAKKLAVRYRMRFVRAGLGHTVARIPTHWGGWIVLRRVKGAKRE